MRLVFLFANVKLTTQVFAHFVKRNCITVTLACHSLFSTNMALVLFRFAHLTLNCLSDGLAPKKLVRHLKSWFPLELKNSRFSLTRSTNCDDISECVILYRLETEDGEGNNGEVKSIVEKKPEQNLEGNKCDLPTCYQCLLSLCIVLHSPLMIYL